MFIHGAWDSHEYRHKVKGYSDTGFITDIVLCTLHFAPSNTTMKRGSKMVLWVCNKVTSGESALELRTCVYKEGGGEGGGESEPLFWCLSKRAN